MSCGGNMMRTAFRPFAHLVDTAAEKWLAVESAAESEREAVRTEITGSFRIGDNPELTFHGQRFLLRIFRVEAPETADDEIQVEVHKISISN